MAWSIDDTSRLGLYGKADSGRPEGDAWPKALKAAKTLKAANTLKAAKRAKGRINLATLPY